MKKISKPHLSYKILFTSIILNLSTLFLFKNTTEGYSYGLPFTLIHINTRDKVFEPKFFWQVLSQDYLNVNIRPFNFLLNIFLIYWTITLIYNVIIAIKDIINLR